MKWIVFLLVFLLAFPVWLPADETLVLAPFKTVKIRRFSETSKLIVPKSLSGRSGEDQTKGISLELLERIEFYKKEGDIDLVGRSSRFEIDTQTQGMKGLLWYSSKGPPDRGDCMKCHSTDPTFSRTRVYAGEETKELNPQPIRQGKATLEFFPSEVVKNYLELIHACAPRQSLRTGISKGKFRSGGKLFHADSNWLEWQWKKDETLSFSTEYRSSAVSHLPIKREIISRMNWRPKKHLSVEIIGGGLLNGLGNYDLGFSDIGSVIAATQRYTPEDLPSLFSKLKDSRFGYYMIRTSYEYTF